MAPWAKLLLYELADLSWKPQPAYKNWAQACKPVLVNPGGLTDQPVQLKL